MFLSIPQAFYAFFTILGLPFLAIGIPVTYLWLIGILMIVALIAFGLLSALFIFNV